MTRKMRKDDESQKAKRPSINIRSTKFEWFILSCNSSIQWQVVKEVCSKYGVCNAGSIWV